MRFLYFLSIFSIFCLTKQIYCLEESVFNSVDPAITKLMEDNKIPGFGITVVKEGEQISKGYGLRDIEQNISVDENTIFAVGSVTKSFTAVLVVKVLSEMFPEKGEKILDVPLSKLAPNANFTFSDRFRYESLTFRDLLAHRTCLTGPTLCLMFDSVPDLPEYIYRIRYYKEQCSIRTEWVYNNAMYGLASYLIGHINGSNFSTLADNFLKEIGMENSFITTKNTNFENFPNLSKGFIFKNENWTSLKEKNNKWVSVLTGAGGLFSSLKDMGTYIQLHLNKGKIGDKQIVKEEAMEWMYKISNLKNYGLGLIISSEKRIGHDGFLPPFYSSLTLYPEHKMGVFTTLNGPSKVFQKQMYSTHDTIYKDQIPEFNAIKFKDDLGLAQHGTKKTETVESVILENIENPEDYVGIYGNNVEGDIQIEYDNEAESESKGHLILKYGFAKATLRKIGENLYKTEWDEDTDNYFHAFNFGNPFKYNVMFDLPNQKISFVNVPFIKNATINTYPNLPWDNNSCSP